MTRTDVDSEQYKVVYEVDYLFLEEYGCQQQDCHSDGECENMDSKQKDDETSPQEQCYNDSLWVDGVCIFRTIFYLKFSPSL